MPKRLIRSIIDFQDDALNSENLAVNFQRLAASKFEWSRSEDLKVYQFAEQFFHERLELPTAQTIRDHFKGTSDDEVLERLKDVESAPVYTRNNFAHLLKQLVEDQNRIKMRGLLKEAEEVVSKGLIIEEGREKIRLQGVKDAYLHFTRQAHDLLPQEHSSKSRGDIREDTAASWQEYEEAKFNKGKAWGAFVGMNHIDKVIQGLKPGELWVHAAFASHLKTMFATNWAYNLVTRYRRNVIYFTLEVQYAHIRRIMSVLHSAHPKFQMMGYNPLDYRKVRSGELSPEEEDFYQRLVLPDWKECEEYCHFEVIAPESDISMSEVRLESELLHKQFEVGQIFVDYSELLQPESKDSNYTIRLNTVIKGAKKLALHFNGGQGVPVCLLHQINREGLESAIKNEGRYNLRALSYSNEVERSADVITTTFLDDVHRANGTAVCCNLKSRDNPLFDPFLVNIDFSCRRMHNMNPIAGTSISVEDDQAVLDAMMEA